VEQKTSALDSLVVSQETIAADTVAKTLQGLVAIIRETGEIMPTAEFNKLDTNRKIMVYLLGLRACSLLQLGNRRVAASVEEVADVVGVDVQRAREYLSRLKRKFLQRTTDGWQLPPARIAAACEEIMNKRK
jgi:hypothetical protein